MKFGAFRMFTKPKGGLKFKKRKGSSLNLPF